MKHLPGLNKLSSCFSLLTLLASLTAAQTGSPKAGANFPVGHWVAEHPSHGGIGSWWNFRPDGTLTMYVGAIATSPVTRTGNTLTQPSGQANTPPVLLTYKVEDNKLRLKTPDGHETVFTRIGAAPSATDPLLGQWRPNPPATPGANPNEAAAQKAMANAVWVFSADGTESVRIPFTSREGTWSASSRTLHIQSKTYSFGRSGTKLTLSQPSAPQETDTYLPDPLFR